MADNSLPKVPERNLDLVTYEQVKEIRVVDTSDNSKTLAINNLTIAGTKVTVAVDGLSGTVDGAFGDVLTAIAGKADTTQVEALDAEKVDKTQSVIAGAGMTGGGALAGDVTLNVVTADDSLVVAADNVKVNTVDDLTSDSATRPLSAKQGKALSDGKVNKTDIEQVRSQATNKVPASKLLDDELTALENVQLPLKANHGYESNPKTLKQVDDEVSQLAGDVEQLAYVKIKNVIANGDFENGLTAPFSKRDGQVGASTLTINSSTPISGNYDIRLTITAPPTSANRPIIVGLDEAANIGDKIYLHFYAKILSGTPKINSFQDGEIDNQIYGGAVVNGRNTRIIDVMGTSGNLGLIYFNSYQAVWDMQMDNFMRINLTETFGAGNEPTEEEMNLLMDMLPVDYFKGEITIPAQKVMQWQLKMIRQNRSAIIALGGTIV